MLRLGCWPLSGEAPPSPPWCPRGRTAAADKRLSRPGSRACVQGQGPCRKPEREWTGHGQPAAGPEGAGGNGRSGLCSLARAACSPRSSSRGRGLGHSHFPSQGYPVSSQIFSASSVTVVVPVPLRREPLPVWPFSWAVFLWGRQGCCRGCRAPGCVLGDERQTEVTTRKKAVTRQDRSWGSSPGTAPGKASFRDGRGGFLSLAWAPDLVQPHPVSRLLRKLLLLFAWLLNPFLSL